MFELDALFVNRNAGNEQLAALYLMHIHAWWILVRYVKVGHKEQASDFLDTHAFPPQYLTALMSWSC